MKILVTGGAGYVGSITVAHLIAAGHEVIVLDSLVHGNKSAIAPEARFIEGDLKDVANLISEADGIEAVLHFAGLIAAGESVTKPEIYWENNVTASLELLATMRKLSIKKLIFSSTAAVYGNPEKTPITEDAVKNPTNPYGMTKLAIDMAITSEAAAHGLAATSLRYFNVAGAYGNLGEQHPVETHIIPLALATAAGKRASFSLFGDDYPTPDGTCVRDYIHVADLARAHVIALEHLEPGKHSIYNLGNGNGFSNKEVIATVEKVSGVKMNVQMEPRREGDPAILIASSERAKAELGWVPEKPELETIIADAWNFYQQTEAIQQ